MKIKRRIMINRELSKRERDILGMIEYVTFQDMVSIVRNDFIQSKYEAKRKLRSLHNGVINGECTTGRVNTINGMGVTGIADGENKVDGEYKVNGRCIVNNIGEICGVQA